MSRAAIALAALVLALLAAGGGYWRGHVAGAAGVQQAWDKERTALAQASQQAETEARTKEQAWQAAIDKEREDARKNLERVAADAAAAADQRVRTVAADYARRAAAANPGSASGSPSTALDLLADLLAGTDDLAEKYAREADFSRVAGLACERAYGALARKE